MRNSLQALAAKANRFDTMYTMIDDHSKYMKHNLISKELKTQ